jgi:hypothetical protein
MVSVVSSRRLVVDYKDYVDDQREDCIIESTLGLDERVAIESERD